MNLETARATVENELKKYVRDDDYFIRVRLGGLRFSALGEFSRPGKYTVLQNRVTIFEAIATAGDLNVLAKRDDIMLIRQYPEGSRAHRINLNNNEIMNSEFYFIRPNDMIYAEPMKVRELGTGTTFIQTIQLLSALATLALLLYTTANR
jgi:polysaccharide export outer membrane protein